MPVNQIADAIGSGAIDGAALPPAMLAEYGVGRLATYHYMIHADAPSLALVMSRSKFESLPARAQDIIRKHSGEWPIASFVDTQAAVTREIMEQLTSNPGRKVVRPSPADLDTAQRAFKSVVAEWVAKSPRNREQLKAAETEIAKLRAIR